MYVIFRRPSRSLAVLQRDVPIGRLHTELPCRPGHHQPLQTTARHEDDKEGRARTANFLQHCSDSRISKMNWGHPWGRPVLTEVVVPNGDLVREVAWIFQYRSDPHVDKGGGGPKSQTFYGHPLGWSHFLLKGWISFNGMMITAMCLRAWYRTWYRSF